MVNPDDVGDASRVKVSGPALKEGKTHEDNPFTVDTKNAGYGGLSLSIEGNLTRLFTIVEILKILIQNFYL